jgi:hypothetical protein
MPTSNAVARRLRPVGCRTEAKALTPANTS